MTMTTRPLQFLRRGQPVALNNVPPDRTLLSVLREDLGCTGTKEGCGEGDCGACTVVLGEARGGKIHYSAINSCIRLAHSVQGMALWTVEDLAEDPLIRPLSLGNKPSRADGGLGARSGGTGMDTRVHEDSEHRATTPPVRAAGLHPAQEAMVQCHGSQCGFCTPGFVMSLFGMYQRHVVPALATTPAADGLPPAEGPALISAPVIPPINRALAQEELSGNLCRCTGYRPILDAAQRMAALPPVAVDEAALLQKLELLALTRQALEPDLAYIAPTTLPALLAARAAHPGAQVVAGCTDVGLWLTKQHRQFAQVLDVTRVDALREVHPDGQHITIGAAATLAEAFAALEAQWPQLHGFAARFAGLPVRSAGTPGLPMRENRAPQNADHEIDARGMAVAPGFINMLSWATTSLIHDGRSQGDIRQGVTLEIFGEGTSPGPIDDSMRQNMLENQRDIRYDIPWTTLGEYLEHLERRGVSPNVASFVGATTVKTHVGRVLTKLGLRDRVQAVIVAYETGLTVPGVS